MRLSCQFSKIVNKTQKYIQEFFFEQSQKQSQNTSKPESSEVRYASHIFYKVIKTIILEWLK